MITYKKSHGLQVVARKEGAIVGKLDDFQFDLVQRVIYGYRLKGAGMFAKAGGVSADKLDQIGRDVAFVESETVIEWKGGAVRNPEEGRAWASQYRGTRVMSRGGASLGVVDDFVFDPASDRVIAIIVDGDRIVELTEQVATGPAAVIVETAELLEQLPNAEKGTNEDWWSRFTKPRPGKDDGSGPAPPAEGQ
ncbi:MAG: PRC-barrel domain-containing protein [Alphaproteobacteria bacterium]|nr:PRC-barrel domain-containing protein [Alphaproteobacteria bacterium]